MTDVLRAWTYEKVKALTNFPIADENIFASGAVGAVKPTDSPPRPFAVVRFSPNEAGLQPGYPVSQVRAQVWLHDKPGSMDNLDKGLRAMKEQLPSGTPYRDSEIVVLEVAWEGDSGDGYDDHFMTNTRYGEFLITYRYVP